jgi:26S proteasome regulatory subunit T1
MYECLDLTLSLSRYLYHYRYVTLQQDDKLDVPPPLDEGDIALLKSYGLGPYSNLIKNLEEEIKSHQQTVKDLIGIKESDTGLSPPSMWDLVGDKQMMSEEAPLQVARCTKIIAGDAETGDDAAAGGAAGAAGPGAQANSSNTAGNKYVINVKQIAKFVVGLGEKVAPTDIEEGMRVGVDRSKYSIQIPLPPKIDPTVSLMTVEDKPDVTYDDVGGAKDAMEKLREVLELPLLHPERFVTLGIDPPKGVLLYGPPGTGKTLSARAVANRTDACFIRVIGSELVQKYVGEGARMVRELFTMARSKRACIVFFDEIDAIGGARSGADENGSDNEVSRTMLQIVTELDGFDSRGNIKVLMATNRPDTLDPALLRPGRLDRKVEFGLPDLEGRGHILKIHSKRMSCDRDIRFELIARLCPNTTGAELHSVCTEAGMYSIRARRKSVSEKDFLDSVNKVVKGYKKFSSTPKYMVYN